VWRAVVDELTKSWHGAVLRTTQEIQVRRAEALQKLRAKQEAAKAELDRITTEYVELQIATGTSSDQLREVLRESIDHKRRVSMELRGEEALRESLEERLAAAVEQREPEPTAKAVADELAEVLRLRQKALERAIQLFESGRGPQSVVDKAREAVAVAKVEYFQARKEAQDSGGAPRLAALNAELSDLATRVTKSRAILQAIEEQIEQSKAQLAIQLRAEMDLASTKQRMDLLKSSVRLFATKCAEYDLDEEPAHPLIVTPWGE
jgi:hypothetical protein